MTRILGIDPGSRITGYGIIDSQGNQHHYRDSGCIQTIPGRPLAERLTIIFQSLQQLIDQYQPDEIAIEQVFMHRNADSALKLGHARGVALCAAALKDLPIHEYAPRMIKQAVVGHGSADKKQVQLMVRALLNLSITPKTDAADALAVAICHSHTRKTRQRLGTISP